MRMSRIAVAFTSAAALAAGIIVAPSASAADVVVTAPSKIVWHPTDPTIAYASRVVAPDNFGLGRTISRIDFATNPPTVTDLVTMTDPAHCHANVNTLAITPDATTLYAGGYSCVMRIPLADPSAYTSGFIGQDWVQRISIGTDAAYATNPEGGAVFKTTKTGGAWGDSWTVLVPAQGGNRPVSRGATLSPDGATLYVGDEGGGKLLRSIDTATGAETTAGTMSPAFTTAVDPKDGAYVLVLNGSTGIQRIQLTGSDAGTTIDATYGDGRLRSVGIDANGVFAYVIADSANALLKIRTSDLAVVSRVTLPPGASDLAVSPIPGNDSVLVPVTGSNTILRFPAAPSAPSSASADPGNGSATINFTPGSDGLSSVTNYEYTLDDTTWTPLSPAVTAGPGTIPGLVNGTSYSIKIRAVNAIGEGAASAAVSVTPRTVPGSPTAVAGTAGTASVNLTGSAPGVTGGSAITGYRIESSTDGTQWNTSIADTGSTATAAAVGSLTNGTSYRFRVSAINVAGAGSASSASAAVTPRTVPGAPTGVTATAGDARATVTWSAPSSNGGAAITGYTATADPGGATCTTASTSCTITGLSNGLSYTFTVRATNAAGTGSPSSPSASVTPDAAITPTPTPTPTPTTDLKSVEGVTIPSTTDVNRLPPAPVSVSATRQTREGARVRVRLPEGAAGRSVQATVITVRDRKGNVAVRVVVETSAGQERATVTVPYVGPGFTVSAYNVNAHGVSAGAATTSPLVRTSAPKRLTGTPAGKPITFARGSARLDCVDERELSAMAKRLKGSTTPVYVTGFAGKRSDTKRPGALSLQRARAVAQYLSDQGVRVWIHYSGAGDSRAKGKPADQRVEVRVGKPRTT